LLIGDLGFDSLALAEIVFFIEDLYQVSVSNEELMRITTVGELRGFIRIKVASSGASSQPPSS
jgi:acyl carrier protein